MSQSAVADIRRRDFSPFEPAIELFPYFSLYHSAISRSHAVRLRHAEDMDTTRASFPIAIFSLPGSSYRRINESPAVISNEITVFRQFYGKHDPTISPNYRRLLGNEQSMDHPERINNTDVTSHCLEYYLTNGNDKLAPGAVRFHLWPWWSTLFLSSRSNNI